MTYYMKTYYMKDTRHLGYSAGLYTTLQDYILLCWTVLYSASTLLSAGPVPMTYYMKDTRHLGYSAGLYSILLDVIRDHVSYLPVSSVCRRVLKVVCFMGPDFKSGKEAHREQHFQTAWERSVESTVFYGA